MSKYGVLGWIYSKYVKSEHVTSDSDVKVSWTQSDATSAECLWAPSEQTGIPGGDQGPSSWHDPRWPQLPRTQPSPPLLLPLWLTPTPALCGADCGIRGLEAFKQEKWLLHMLPEECRPPDAPESPPPSPPPPIPREFRNPGTCENPLKSPGASSAAVPSR